MSPFRAGLLSRTVRIHAHGGAEQLTLESVPVQKPSHDGVLVRVEAAGVNFIDVYKRSGLYKVPLPCTLGEEGAGAVVAVGAGVSAVAPGDRVAWTSVLGSYADYVEVPSAKIVPVPGGVSTSDAAAIMLQGMTAHYLATSTYPLKRGDRCLVHAGSGGVGLLLVQLAKLRGAFVIATVGSPEKAALAHAAGADATILYREQDFVTETKRLTDGQGVHVVYDSVGQTTFLNGFDVLAPRGMMVLFGQSSGPASPLDPQLLNSKGSLFLTRPTLGHYIATREELLARSGALFEMVANRTLSVRIGAEFPLGEAASAHRALEGRLTVGKVLLRP